MKTFKPYLLSLLTLISAVPMGAMQSAPQPAHQANVSISDAQKLLNDLRKAWNAEIEKLQNNTEQS